jgi:hypothetical protein
MTIEDALRITRESIRQEKADIAESPPGDMNSYGAGYDNGVVAGLERAVAIMLGLYET